MLSRSLSIAAVLLCASGLASSALASPPGRHTADCCIRAQRDLDHATARLHAAERIYSDFKRRLDEVLARQSAASRELAAVERQIHEARRGPSEWELRRLHEQLEGARRDAGVAEADLARARNLAAEAGRAAEAARAEYFRVAECSGAVIDARERLALAERGLEDARHFALRRVQETFEWRRASSWRDEVARRLADAERYGAGRYELDRLRRDLAEAQGRIDAMEREALACDPAVIDAEARLASAHRGHDELWARIERDLDRDHAYSRAAADAHRLEQDAARIDRHLCDIRETIARLEGEINRLHGLFYVSDTRGLEHRAGELRRTLDRLGGDARDATDCLRRAERDLHDARCAYDAAVIAYRRCQEEQRVIRQRPPYDDGRGSRGRDDDRERERTREREDNRDDRGRGDARSARGNDRSDGGGDRGTGTYRDRGERYERARQEDDPRRRTRG